MKIGTKQIAEKINWRLNKWQKIVTKNQSRFKIIVAGRRSGKTLYVCKEEIIIKEFFKKNKIIWIIAPNYDLAGRIWDMLYGLAINELRDFINYINNSRGMYKISTFWNTIIEAKSADDPKTLVGKGIDLLVMDETASVKKQAWKESLMPALIDRHGRAVFIGTPKGKNWFYQLYLKGQDKEKKNYSSWQFTSYDNDFIKPEEIDEIAKDMDEIERKQEIYAEFIEGAGQVFRNIHNCIKGNFEKWQEGKEYIGGCDLAKYHDFTVIKILRKDTRQIVFTDRFSQLDWGIQKARIKSIADKYKNPPIWLDSTGVGDAIYDDLINMGVNIQPYKFTNETKMALIKNLSIMFENEEIFIPKEDKQMINELEIYQYNQLPNGKFQYGAPEGLHDDEVTALMLVAWGLKKEIEPQIIFV